jgi:galactosylceramidase
MMNFIYSSGRRHLFFEFHLFFDMISFVFLAILPLATSIALSGTAAYHVYDGGVGALSAGASSRLLWDYDEPQKSQILDYLFKPNFGASLNLLKVEIGGDCQSTDGTEPSHMHTKDDLNCRRGYEFWLIDQAKQRNANISIYALSWGVPFWIGNGSYFSSDNIAYQVQFCECVKSSWGYDVDYIGIWNERSWGNADYVVSLRDSLDAAGFANTKIILPDGGSDIPGAISRGTSNVTYRNAVHGIGVHYPCDDPNPAVQAEPLNWVYWASEDSSTVADWAGGGCWGRLLVENYVRMNQTTTIMWSLIWSVYQGLPYFGNGLMYAYSPWSGSYEVNSPIWTSAHVTQAVEPGWKYLTVNSGGSGYLPGGGAYITLVPSDLSQVSVIVQTLVGDCLRCKGPSPVPLAQNITFVLSNMGPRAGSVLQVWKTTKTSQFVQQPSITVAADNSFTIFIDVDEMITITTLTTLNHGTFADPVPVDRQFPLPYADDFNNYEYDTLARYFSDQAGSFATRNGTLVQVVPIDPGANAWVPDLDPITLVGSPSFGDIVVSVKSAFNSSVASRTIVTGNLQTVDSTLQRCDNSSLYQKWFFNATYPNYFSNNVDGNVQCIDLNGCSAYEAIYYPCVTNGCANNLGQMWSFGPNNQFISSLNNWCLTFNTGNQTLSTSPCVGSESQQWSYSDATNQLSLVGSGNCLASYAPETYVQVCSRITGFSGFTRQVTPGYCFVVYSSGSWSITAGPNLGIIANGTLAQPFDSSAWHQLSFTVAGNSIIGEIDGMTVAVATDDDNTYTTGFVALGSGYHYATFDNFEMNNT